MAKAKVTLVGVPEFMLALNDWTEDMFSAFQNELKDARALALEAMQRDVPVAAEAHYLYRKKGGKTIGRELVQPGSLKKSLRGTIEKRGYGLTLRLRATAPHAHLLEFGTVRMGRKPFFLANAMRTRRRFNEEAKRILSQPRPKVGTGRPVVVESLGGLL